MKTAGGVHDSSKAFMFRDFVYKRTDVLFAA